MNLLGGTPTQRKSRSPNSHSEKAQQRAGQAAGWDHQRPRLQNLRTHLRQYLDRHPYWAALVKANPGLSPYSLRHGYAYRGALAGIPLRQLAASMGHDVRTHMKHYGQWTDEAGLDAALGAATAVVTSLHLRIEMNEQGC